MEDTIRFETAVLAKEKGFKPEKPTTDYVKGFTVNYDDDDNIISYEKNDIQEEDWCRHGYYLRPTQSVLQKWLRDVMNIDVFANSVRFTGYIEIGYYTYSVMGCSPSKNYRFETYEEALEFALIEGLKLININKDE